MLVLSDQRRDTYLLFFESFQLCAAAPEALHRLRRLIGDPCSCCSSACSVDLIELSLTLVNVARVAQVVDVNKLLLRGSALNALEVFDVYKVLVVAVARWEQRPAAVLTPVLAQWATVDNGLKRFRHCMMFNRFVVARALEL
jgi:hypothetical protein